MKKVLFVVLICCSFLSCASRSQNISLFDISYISKCQQVEIVRDITMGQSRDVFYISIPDLYSDLEERIFLQATRDKKRRITYVLNYNKGQRYYKGTMPNGYGSMEYDWKISEAEIYLSIPWTGTRDVNFRTGDRDLYLRLTGKGNRLKIQFNWMPAVTPRDLAQVWRE